MSDAGLEIQARPRVAARRVAAVDRLRRGYEAMAVLEDRTVLSTPGFESLADTA
jgi:hypothetical protein